MRQILTIVPRRPSLRTQKLALGDIVLRHFAIAVGLGATACGPAAPELNTSTAPPPRNVNVGATSRASSEKMPSLAEWKISRIDWDDADSGNIYGPRFNGVGFRLFSVDAPEKGGVDAAIGAALCEEERALGLKAWDEMKAHTARAELAITGWYGFDKMKEPRMLIDLAADGADVGEWGVGEALLAPWPHDGANALVPNSKPDWCPH